MSFVMYITKKSSKIFCNLLDFFVMYIANVHVLLYFFPCFGVFLVELEILKPGIFWTLESRLLSLYLNIVLKFLNSFQTFSRLMENFIEYNSWDWQNLQRKSPRGLMMYDYPLLCSEWSNMTWILNWFVACKLCYTYTWLALPSEWRWDIL